MQSKDIPKFSGFFLSYNYIDKFNNLNRIPGSFLVPTIVYVLPEFVTP